MSDGQRLVSPTAIPQRAAETGRSIAKALRENALLAFPPEAFEKEIVVRRFFGRQQIILNRPAGIQHVLVDNPQNYRRTAATIRMLRPLLGGGLLLSEGEEWKRQRRIVAPALAPRMMPIVARHIAQATGAAIERLTPEAPVNLLAEMQFLALEIAGRALFSVVMDRHRAELRELITGYTEHIGRPSLLDFLLPMALPSPRDLARRRFRRRWMGLIGRIIAERAAIDTVPDDLFALLSSCCDRDRLADQVATLITAGHETTALALFWALYLLAVTPAAQERVAAEVAGADLGPDNAADVLPRLVYTRAVVHEALRLYPPAFTLVRQARRADNAGGVAVPAGAILFIAPWVLHRHRRLWAEPERFDPGRFLPGAPPPDRFAYLPFGMGPRVCVGAQFALTEATLVLAALIQAFRIERADHEPVAPTAMVTTQPEPHPLFRLHRRALTPAASWEGRA
jgi:cytochrome P450